MRAFIALARLQPGHAQPLLAFAAMLSLSACGVAGSSHASSGSVKGKRALASSATSEDGTCHEVEDPKPKGTQHIPKPTLKLDASKSYVVQLDTNCGDIDIELAVKRAPRIAASFAYLVKRGFYDDLTFHLVLSGFVIQGGDPQGDGSGGPGYTIVEAPPKDFHYTPGTVAMAKGQTDPAGTAGSQFFIVVGSKADLPAQYALLGKVTSGWSTVVAISHVPTEPAADDEESAPTSPIVISRAFLTVSG